MSLSQEAIIAFVGLLLAIPPTYLALRYCLRRSRQQPTYHRHDLEVQTRGFPQSRTSSSTVTLALLASWPSIDGSPQILPDPLEGRSPSIQRHGDLQTTARITQSDNSDLKQNSHHPWFHAGQGSQGYVQLSRVERWEGVHLFRKPA